MSSGRAGRLATVIAIIPFALLSCRKAESKVPQQGKAPQPVTVTVQPAVLQDVLRTVPVIGDLRGDEQTTISAKVPGRIAQIFKDVGDRVALNEPLAQVDKTDYELARNQAAMAVSETLSKLGLSELPGKDFDLAKVPTVHRASLQVENAKAKLERGKQVSGEKAGAISEQELADLQTTFEVAKSSYDVELLAARSTLALARAKQSELQIAIQRLEDSTVRAPAATLTTTPAVAATPSTKPAGRYAVAARLVSVGEYVQEAAALYRLVADDPIKYQATLPERYLADIKVGQNVLLSVAAYPQPFTGKLSRISPQIDPLSRRIQIEVLVPNPDGKLQPGSFATGLVQTTLEKQVTFVPQDAIVSFAGVQKLFTIKDGKAVERTIETGVRQGAFTEIVSGFEGVDPVVIEGAGKLADGTPISVKQPQSAESPATRPASAELPSDS